MPKAGRYHEGVPCWVALTVPDVQRAQRFYRELFGWEFVPTGPAEWVATLYGAQVAGVAAAPEGRPAGWTTYLAVADAAHTAALVRVSGGRLAREPYEVPDLGRAALAVDPLGVTFGLWQGAAVAGAGLVNEPGTFTWNEHLSADPDAARTFYRQVFGYTYDRPDGGYTVFRADGFPAGGIGPGGPGPNSPEPGPGPGPGPGPDSTDRPATDWLTQFATADADRAAAHVRTLGGTVLTGPDPTPFGRSALVRDDSGAAFALIAVPPDESAEAA
ncbi:VOC family protein [Kitasatospora sp. NPDC097643]|uniref:VOC family protein n=1 Tax=Kitasatospora sp. NPDC097643 TaxID=3157230 RepID=UPI00332D9EFF